MIKTKERKSRTRVHVHRIGFVGPGLAGFSGIQDIQCSCGYARQPHAFRQVPISSEELYHVELRILEGHGPT